MDEWPKLEHGSWADTQATLHLWTQIVGKIRLRLEPLVNHWWNVTLYVSPCGLTTSVMRYPAAHDFGITFDFVAHRLRVDGCEGDSASFPLQPMSVAEFYRTLMETLHGLGIDVTISKKPNEIPEAIPFDRDTTHASYDRDAVSRFWQVLRQTDRVFKRFRAGFVGKASPVQFFWGSFDLAATRFSGRPAPPHPGGFPNMPDWATREAYSHEEFSVGFWPGGYGADALFYAYAYPEPPGFAQHAVRPSAASWSAQLKEFVLPYEAVRAAADPQADLLAFCESAYAAEADLAHWDRAALERRSGGANVA